MVENRQPVVAVTGARGLVGQTLVRHLGETGFEIRRLSRTRFQDNGLKSAILPPFDAEDDAFAEALSGATHVIHAAALTNADRTASERDFMDANARLTEKLARAAAHVTSGRFVFISSIRAVAGQGFTGTIGASTTPQPSDAYGRSKLQGEIAATTVFGDSAKRLCILRPAPVYGRGMKGNLGRLLRLAHTPYPLPLGALNNRRSLLDAEALARAAVHVLSAPSPVDGAYVVCDSNPVTVAEIIAAFRTGMGRSPRLFSLPPALLKGLASLAGQRRALRGIFAEEICDPSALEGKGWRATENSIDGLAALANPVEDGAQP